MCFGNLRCRSRVHSGKKSKSGSRTTSHTKRHSRNTHFDSAPLTGKKRATNPHQIRRTRIQQGFRLLLYIARTKLHSAVASTPPTSEYRFSSFSTFSAKLPTLALSLFYFLSSTGCSYFPFLSLRWKRRKNRTRHGVGKLKNGTSELARRTPGTLLRGDGKDDTLVHRKTELRLRTETAHSRYSAFVSCYPAGSGAFTDSMDLCKKGNKL